MRRLIFIVAIIFAAGIVPASQATFPGANGRIVYQATVGDHVQLFTVQSDGSDVRQLTYFTDSDAVAGSWSPDARRIVFERDFPDSTQIEVMNADGSNARALTPAELDFTPAYSPSGREIVFERATAEGDGVWVMNAQGGGLRQITNNPPPANGCGCDESPVFSPDGERIAFVRVVDGQTTAVFIADKNGHNLRQVTPYSLGVSEKLDWSPDGMRLLVSTPPPDVPNVALNVITIRPNGTGLTQLTHDTTPELHNLADSFSPDGREIVFARNAADGVQLYTMNADGTGITEITHGDGAHYANWGPRADDEADD